MPDLWPREVFPATVFASRDIPDKIMCSISRSQGPSSSLTMEKRRREVLKTRLQENLIIKLTGWWKYRCVYTVGQIPSNAICLNQHDTLCLTQFAACYCKAHKKRWQEKSGSQPQVLTDSAVELQHLSMSQDAKNLRSVPTEVAKVIIRQIKSYNK